MRTIKTYRKVGAFYIACEEDFSTSIRADLPPICKSQFRLRDLRDDSGVGGCQSLQSLRGVILV